MIVQDNKHGVVLTVHVQSNGSRTERIGFHGDALKVRVAACPIAGVDIDKLIRFFAERFAIPQANILIQAGATSRHKCLYVKGVTTDLARARLMLGKEKGMVKG